MASLGDLSDSEIRLKLTELGYPVGPITTTTRKVLLKKLKYLQEQSKSPVSDRKDKSRQNLSRFSSGEDSEDEVAANTRNRKSMPPPPPKGAQKLVKRRSLNRHAQEDDFVLEENTVNSEFLAFPSASSTLNSSELDSRSRSQKYSPKNVLLPTNNINHNHDTFSSFSTRSNPRSVQSKLSSRKTLIDPFDTGSDTDGIDEIGLEEKKVSPRRSTQGYSSFIPSISSGLSQARMRFQPQAGLYGNLQSESPRYSPKSGAKSETNNSPFSSDFVKRLSAASNKSGSNSGLPSRLLDVKESDDEDVNSTRSHTTHHISGNIKRGPVATLEEKLWRNASMISRVLLFIVAIFFCGLGIVYLNVRFKETPITTTDTNFPVCKVGGKPGANCVLSEEFQPAMKIFRELYEVLNERATQYACNGGLESSSLTESQITELLVAKSQRSVWEYEKHFGNIKVLIDANPQWGVEVSGDVFDIPSPNLPFNCYIFSLFYGIIGSALRFVFAAIVLFGIAKGVYWWRDRQDRNKNEVFKVVESIIDVLSTHQQSSAGDSYLAISHVRDQLIPPHQRDKMAPIWDKAVAYLEENESRVRTEVQQMLGEEFRVWRWLPAARTNGKRKVWQGQAFETMEGSVNSLPISPTSCLKIRHMFDSDVEVGEDWMTRVQDAILEKCEGVNVLHVAVDKHSHEGCVYVKCSTQNDAGRAYRALHGSWFDSKLVTVKYLRLERYHERFPEAAHCTRPLRPSNDRKLSLQ